MNYRLFKLLLSLFLINTITACGSGTETKPKSKTVNTAPVAKITISTTGIKANEVVDISGELSTDANGDKITYQWSVLDSKGVDVILTESEKVKLAFTPQYYGTYTITLTVSDSELTHQSSTQLVVEPETHNLPKISVSYNQINKVGAVSWFNAEQSEPSTGQQLSYHWSLVTTAENSQATLANVDKSKAYLIADVVGEYQVMLVITNSENQLTSSETFVLTIDQVATNSTPVAVINSLRATYAQNEKISLNGSASYDVDNHELSYQWAIEKEPENSESSLVASNSPFAEFTASAIGEYQLKLTVSDGDLTDDTTQAFTIDSNNTAPVANAGEDQTLKINTETSLNGLGSFDTEGQNLSYQWALVSKPNSSKYEQLETDIAEIMFSPDIVGNYVFSLVVFDGVSYSEADLITVEVFANQLPVAILGNDIRVGNSSTVNISGHHSYDPEKLPLTYAWKFISSPEGFDEDLSGENRDEIDFSPTLEGTYTLQLIVNDGEFDSIPDTINIIMLPVITEKLTVSGSVVDFSGKPLKGILVKGIMQMPDYSDDSGHFEIELIGNNHSPNKIPLVFSGDQIKTGFLSLPETNEKHLALGSVTLPALQNKKIKIIQCDNYSGPEKVLVRFFLDNELYNNMRFTWPSNHFFNVGDDYKEIPLPAKGLLSVLLGSQVTASITTLDGKSFFVHEYQNDDTQEDLLTLSVCD
jgi:hypothetical protein